jgi:hypothetical protein
MQMYVRYPLTKGTEGKEAKKGHPRENGQSQVELML